MESTKEQDRQLLGELYRELIRWERVPMDAWDVLEYLRVARNYYNAQHWYDNKYQPVYLEH